MLAIQFTFTANRYHATPWGRHVNEGAVEWPPSPWRILRAIVATWRRNRPDLSDQRMTPIITAMTSEPPRYYLPPAYPGHTRHYMPLHEGRNERRTLVLDAFLSIGSDQPVYAIWPNAALDIQKRGDLQDILRNMPYLGRAESWVDASLTEQCPEPNCYPPESDALTDGSWDVVRTLAPRTDVQVADLEVETSQLHSKRRIDPEGAYWQIYIRQANNPEPVAHVTPGPNQEESEVIRFALASKVRPMTSDTLYWAELARKAAMAQYGRRNDNRTSESLSGKKENGQFLSNDHQHAFYLPTDDDGDGRLDHLTIWTPAGLNASEFAAVVGVRHLVSPGRELDQVRLAYQSHGRAQDFAGVSRLFECSREWRSLTPYIPPWHIKVRGRGEHRRIVNGPADQIRKEVRLRWPGHIGLVSVAEADPQESIAPMRSSRSSGFRPVDFRRYRANRLMGVAPSNLTIEYSEPVGGPIALGFGCHYGLGLFVPA